MTTIQNRRRFTVDDYYRMAAAGILKPSDRVELIEGEIVEMSPIGSRHGAAVNRLTATLIRLLKDDAIVSVQNPIQIGELSEPQPDLTVLKPRDDFYEQAHPGPKDVLLVIEVADTTLEADRRKAVLYASARIPEYWLVNLTHKCIEVHRSPARGGYQSVKHFKPGEKIATQAFPKRSLSVDRILA